MWSLVYVVAFVGSTTLPLWNSHVQLHGSFNLAQIILSLFCNVNLLICIWELALFYERATIKAHYTAMKKLLPVGGLPQPMFLFEHVPFFKAFTLRHWSKVWSTYSLMDPSYSDSTTFGFWIDAGNGHVTLIPSILFALGMTWDLGILPRLFGLIGFVYFWQMFYGTVLYFSSYFHNKRWKGRPGLGIVICANALWLAGPAYGMVVSYAIVMSDSLVVVRS